MAPRTIPRDSRVALRVTFAGKARLARATTATAAIPGPSAIKGFQKAVWSHYRQSARRFPWRSTNDAYRILVSELMLQQTQTARVLPYYRRFIERFPTVKSLAQAPLSEVIRSWKGLGYNRRARFLHQSAKRIVNDLNGSVPDSYEALRSLPGVGDYTARAVLVFAFHQRHPLIETNIRTALIFHFLPDSPGHSKVAEERLRELCVATLPSARKCREWFYALMDYGAHLKLRGETAHRRAAMYTRQSPFVGSLRQLRGWIVATLSKAPNGLTHQALHAQAAKAAALPATNRTPERMALALAGLTRDGLVTAQRGRIALASD